MNQLTAESESMITAIADALRGLEITDKQREDLKDLYENPEGFEYEVDLRNRPQGPTLDTSRRIGSKLKDMLQLGEKYGMNVVGNSRPVRRWCMRETFRQAINQLNWFPNPIADGIRELDEDLLRRLALVGAASASEIEQSLAVAETAMPTRVSVSTFVFIRSAYVIYAALSRANGQCEHCQEPAPFNRASDETPYLEVHHIKRLSDGGKDSLSNVEALCPNCHRLKHFGPSSK